MSLDCQLEYTAPSLASGHDRTNDDREAVVSDVVVAAGRSSAGHELSAIERLDATGRVALLLTALAGRCDQWALIEATGTIVQGPVGLEVLDPLVAMDL